MNEEYKKRRNIKKEIIIEYALIIATILITIFAYPYLYDFMVGDNTGLDGIGQALGVVIILRVAKYIAMLIFGIINPIRILIVDRHEMKELTSIFKKILCIFIILLPIGIALLTIFENNISNYQYEKTYMSGDSEYTVSEEKYKLPSDFYKELEKRGLAYNENTAVLRDKLNADHDCVNYKHINGNMITQKCYEKSTMVGVKDDHYYDSNDKEEISDMNNDVAPVYIYNAILTLPSEEENLQYAALGRYSYNSDDYGDYKSTFKDIYIECKIMYVNGDIYAIIGLGESYSVEKDFINDGSRPWYDTNYPYNMIISEKENITTYYKDKYYSNGAIRNESNSYEMAPNTNTEYWMTNFPVRKVDRLDINSINKIAKELQEGTLKDTIEKHFSELKTN